MLLFKDHMHTNIMHSHKSYKVCFKIEKNITTNRNESCREND